MKRLGHLLCLAPLSLALWGCSEPESTTGPYASFPGTFEVGAPCTRTEDCPSGLCVKLGPGTGVCSRACSADADCPASPTWKCLDAKNIDAKVCACRPNASSEVCGDGVDNDCDGRIDDCLTCDGKVVSSDDPKNCGGCGVACRSDQICAQGACRCKVSQEECGGHCVDTDSDEAHCGGCGASCQPGQTCSNGSCSCALSGQQLCPGQGCVSLSSSAANCGACGKACDKGLVCSNGQCACPVGGLPDHCPGKGCVSFASDSTNCGGCGNVCASGASCVGGKCTCPVSGQQSCSGACIDTLKDPKNCGGCGQACAPGEACSLGKCSCASGLHCDGACVAAGDEQNCGGCGVTCGPSQTCQSGKCSCGFGKAACGQACVATSSDPNNCGGCGKTCLPGQQCLGGACGCSYPAKYCAEASACVDLSTDEAHCGSCTSACKPTQLCTGGACACPVSTEQWCASAGSCIDTKSDPNNCGGCDKACPSGQVCSFGSCKCPTSGQQWCAAANACVDVYNDPSNCGVCGKVCPGQTHCASGQCVCDAAGKTVCSGACVDLSTDPQNCGSCGKACPGAMACASGTCTCPAPVVGDAVRLTQTSPRSIHPAAAWDGAHVGVVYYEAPNSVYAPTGNVYFALLNPDGSRAIASDLALTSYQVANGNGAQYAPDIVWNGSEYGVIWTYHDGTGPTALYNIYFVRLGPDGVPKSKPVNITALTPAGPTMYAAITARLAWSSAANSYAIATGPNFGDTIYFQRIGADGTAPDAVNAVSQQTSSSDVLISLAAAPDGEWAIGGHFLTGVGLVRFNPDGSHTKPTVILSQSGTYASVALAHDGTTWAAAYGYDDGRFQRGASPSTPFVFSKPPAGSSDIYRDFALLPGANTMEIAWTRGPANQKNRSLNYRRYLSPSGGGNYLTGPIDDVTVLPTDNIPDNDDIALVEAGATKRLVLWSDNRFGYEELFVRSIDLGACP